MATVGLTFFERISLTNVSVSTTIKGGMFNEMTLPAGLGGSTSFVGWGVGFLDFDNDTWEDLFWVSGHIFPEVEQLKTDIHYKDHAILYRNLGDGKFADISARAGPAFAERHSARGAAFGDYDNDGSVDIVVNNQNEPPSLLRLADKPHGNWVVFHLEGTRSNRSAIGARLKLTIDTRVQMDEVRSGGSYLYQSDLRVRFGLGETTIIDRVEIDWPSGTHEVEMRLPVNQIVTLREPPVSTR
jgi:hypothetical protein